MIGFIQYLKRSVSHFLLFGIVLLFIYKINAQEYELVWADEFDGTELDSSKWSYQIGNGQYGWGNNESEYYREENAVVSDGVLTITAKKENFNGFQYTSSRIRTINNGDWTYGKFEIRAKMPIGQGIWPAIWMMPTDNFYGGWAASGEIDIMEYLGHDSTRVYGTLHYGGAWPDNKNSGTSKKLTGSGYNEDFHTFTLVWQEGKIQWYVDSVLYQTQTAWNTNGASFPAPFDKRFHLILNCAVGGNWPGYPNSSTKFPQDFVIDYVRVYQQSVTDVTGQDKIQPKNFTLNQNYPNPFNSQTIISYSISKSSHVKLTIYDMLGRKISVLVDKVESEGLHHVSLDAADLTSGTYIYNLETENGGSSRKLILIK